MRLALVFPGQGSQYVGMAKALAEAFPSARETLAEADAALGSPLTRLLFEILVPAGRLTLEQAALAAKADGLGRAYADAPVAPARATALAVVEDARRLAREILGG